MYKERNNLKKQKRGGLEIVRENEGGARTIVVSEWIFWPQNNPGETITILFRLHFAQNYFIRAGDFNLKHIFLKNAKIFNKLL